jgi:hypothetical protein
VKRKARRREAINSGDLNCCFFVFLLERKRHGLHREARGQGKRPVRAACFLGVSGSDSFLSFLFLDVPFFDSFFFLFFGKNQN